MPQTSASTPSAPLDELQDELDGLALAGVTPTLFEHVNPLGIYDFSTDRKTAHTPLRAASAA